MVMLALSASVSWAAEDLGPTTVKGVRYPKYDEKGQLEWEINGDSAKVMPNSIVEISNLKATIYKNNQVEASVTAPSCTYDEKGGRAGSEGPVRIAQEDSVITGTGFYLNIEKQKIQIFKDVKVVLKNARTMDTGVKK
jgi:LPS export ABC transporter protein LptC